MNQASYPHASTYAVDENAEAPVCERGKIGVLLCNLGTPDGTDYWSMRRYLREFLSDRRVVEASRLTWFFILNLCILTFRPSRKARDYAFIWNRELNESPLKTVTRSQVARLQERFETEFPFPPTDVIVDWGMRYGNPSLASAIARLDAAGCDRILLLPLYPQYAAATTATACDKVFDVLRTMRRQPSLRVASPYYDDPAYIEQLAHSVTETIGRLDFVPDIIVASFHGTPKQCELDGDPYHGQCLCTGKLLRQKLGLPVDKLVVTFQSRFGNAEWLKPYTDETIRSLPALGMQNVVVVTPGFSADCLETIDEIGRENAEHFFAAGGENYVRVNCLNDSDGGMRVIETIVQRELEGWI
jgi:ferrochelatase